MEHSTAVNLISKGVRVGYPQRWADVGSGDGTFTFALASILERGSLIYAIDQSEQVLLSMPSERNGVTIEQCQANIITDDIFLDESLDGIILANVLHFIPEKKSVLEKLLKTLKPESSLLIIEYDTIKETQWIPFPLPWNTLQTLMTALNLPLAIKIAETPSSYGHWKLYSAFVNITKHDSTDTASSAVP